MPKKTTTSGWAIPDDWDGETWACWKVQFPDSPKFKLLLRSMLYALSRARDWDKNTGTVTQASLIGWDIFAKNEPLRACDTGECPETPETGSFEAHGGGIVIIEDDDMGQVVTAIEVTDEGKLRVYYGHCCYEDLDGIVVNSGAISPNPGGAPWEISGETPPTYSACGKADAVTSAIYLVLQGTYDALTTVDYPWQVLGDVENAVGYNLDNKWMAALVASWLLLAGLSSLDMFSGLDVSDFVGFAPGNIFSVVDRQSSRCALEGLFASDATGVPDADTYDAVKSAIQSRNFLYGSLIDMAISCLGRENLDTIVKLGAANTDADCACPEQADPFAGMTDDYDWSYTFDFRNGDYGGTLGVHTFQNSSGLFADNMATAHRAYIEFRLDIDNVNNGSVIQFVGIVISLIGDEGLMSSGTAFGTEDESGLGANEIIAVTGNDYARAGTFNIQHACSVSMDAGDTNLLFELQAGHDTDVTQRILAVVIAGSGPGPLNWPIAP